MKNGVLPLNKKIRKQLKQKPETRKHKPEEIHPIKFNSIDAENARKAALKTRVGAGPSGLDDDGWKRIFTSNQFGDSTDDLCKTLAEVIKKLCAVEHQSTSLEAFFCESIDLPRQKSWTKPYSSR